jgi:cytosine/adenosine deaminase-related metal-dependent hydrolase
VGATDGYDERFEEAYGQGILDEDVPPADRVGAPARPQRVAPAGGFAFGGCVLTPEGAVEGGYLVVAPDGTIDAVQRSRPQQVPVIETGGVLAPGLIDLHGHPEFNVFAAWEPPRLFTNRYQWRGSEVYRQLVRDPQNRLLSELPTRTQSRYAEIRALVGGVTAIQGASGRYPDRDEALVRNVDLRIFGAHRARSMIDLPSASSRDLPRLRRILDQIAAGEVTALYVHLAEGRRDDQRSQREFDRLVELDALTPATVVIHGSALTGDQFGQMADAGAKLVWSPQSNLRLYGETTDVAAALEAGVAVGLGADWLPSGSPSLLGEVKVARRVLARQGAEVPARRLVDMVTADAARIAGLGDFLGSLAPGRPADVVVFERHHEDPWQNVVDADPSWVELVMINADVGYGRDDWVRQVAGPDRVEALEPVVAWGQDMLLDTSFTVSPVAERPPTLTRLRADLIAAYPQVGPIFA